MKKCLASILAVLMLALPLAACAPAASQAAGSQPAAPAGGSTKAGPSGVQMPEKITFFTSQAKYKDAYKTTAEAIQADYGTVVEFQVVPDNEFTSLLQVKLSTSEVPDIFQFNYPTSNGTIGAAEYCVDLSDEPWMDRLINPELIKDPDDGKIYAQPKESSSTYLAVYYNIEVLKQAGIENPKPKTYDEFLAICEAVKTKTDAVPLLMTDKDTWTTQIYPTTGYSLALGDKAEGVYDKLIKNEIKWKDIPEVTGVLTRFKELYEKGYTNADHMSVDYNASTEYIASGKAAMYYSIEPWVNNMTAQYPEVQLGAFPMPQYDNAKLGTGKYVQGLFIPKAGKQVEAVKEWLRVWSLPEYQDLFHSILPGFPAFKDVNGGQVEPCVQALVDEYIATGEYVFQANDMLVPMIPINGDLWNYYIEYLSEQKTLDQMLDAWQKFYEDYMREQKQPGF